MANIVGDIAIQVGADIGPLVRELGKASTATNKFGNDAKNAGAGMAFATKAGAALASGVLAAGVAMAAFTAAAMDNIDALSKQARVAGVSVATFQSMALVAEEAGVSSEALSKSLVKMQDNIANLSRGGAAQVEAFRRLGISFSDISGLAVDEQFAVIAEKISAIADPTMRTAAALDVFGKSGADALNMMTGYRSAAENAARFQREFGLAVSDTDAANVEAANDAIGRAQMAAGALGTTLAVTLAPAIEAVANATVDWIANLIGTRGELEELLGSVERASSILGQDVVDAIAASGTVSESSAESIERLRAAYDGLGRDVSVAIQSIGNELPTLLENGLDQLAKDLSDATGEMETLQGKFEAGAISASDYETQMSAALTRATELLTAAGQIDGVDMSSAVAQVGRLAEALSIARGVAFALRAAMPGGVGGARAASATTGAGASGTGTVSFGMASSPRPERAPNDIDFGLPDLTGGGSSGGGGGDAGTAELERLRAQFATESELLDEQYQERLTKLAEFRDQKLISEAEYNELEAQAKEDHEKRLADIEDGRRQERLQAIAGAFSDLSSLMKSGNEKLFKIGQAAAIADAVVTGYQAAVDAWQKGMKIGGPPVAAAFTAASLAKTGSMIASIAAQTASGGGSASSGTSGTVSAPTNTANITVVGDYLPVASLDGLFSQINDGLRQGRIINLVRT